MPAPPPTPVTIDQIVQDVDRLPPLPQAVLKVSQLLEKEDVRAEELADVIKLDPELTAQLLKLCNSAYYGVSREVTSMRDAVALLGLKTIKSIVYAVLSHQVLDRPIQGYTLNRGDLWMNAITGAEFGRYLAQRHGYREPDNVFTAALLRDLGKIVLERYVGQSRAALDQASRSNTRPTGYDELEKAILGLSHMEVGMRLAEKWNLPRVLQLSVGYHHHPSELPADASMTERQVVTYVHLADCFTMMMGVGIGGDGLQYPLDVPALRWIGVDVNAGYVDQTLALLYGRKKHVQQLADSLVTS